MAKKHIDSGGSLVDCVVNDGHYCIYCAQEANKLEIDDAYARGLAEGEAKGLERAAEIIRNDVKSAAENPTKPIAVTWSEKFRDEAAKIREGK